MTSLIYGPVAGGGGKWKTFSDQDFSAMANQDLFPDGWQTIPGGDWYTNINVADALGMAIVNGLGVRITPIAGRTYANSPGLTRYLGSLGKNVPVRMLMYISSITGTPDATSLCLGGFSMAPYNNDDRASMAGMSAAVLVGRPATRFSATTATGGGVAATTALDDYRYAITEFSSGFFSGMSSIRFNNAANFDTASPLYVNNHASDVSNYLGSIPGYGPSVGYPGAMLMAGGLIGGNAGGVSFYIGRVIIQYKEES